jgi:heterodisulfide reductase subunit C
MQSSIKKITVWNPAKLPKNLYKVKTLMAARPLRFLHMAQGRKWMTKASDRCEDDGISKETPKVVGKLIDELKDMCDEDVFGCYQCGTCAAGYPFIEEMDLTPDEVLRYIIMDKNEVLNSKTIWLCASCFTCAERCPRDIDITKVMEALRQIVLRSSIDETHIEKLTDEDKKNIPQLAFVCLFRKNIG